ncbi:hypothetical protein H4J38_09230 [Colwellia sp. BRX10-3]|uniref:hypothetical protein n=1 Tax=Colwellia sp. BRX10-3 TaxID=2759844 RepID=UPI0015F7808F|nr:hypothetical protein [Colwellia sp. BRX10-3]MBA6390954.1 hypothetical protein [Colwellia sp. BRX10-3]
MYKLIVLSSILLVTLFSTAAKSNECDISGVWNHSAKPAKLFIDLNKAEISVHSHENNSESIGLVALKSVTQGSTENTWNAKMYSAAEDSFVNVKIASKSCNKLSVSFNGEEVLGLFR